MKKKICWVSLVSMLVNVAAYGLFVMILGGGLYQSAIWYIWMTLCVVTPFAPIYAKYYRVQHIQSGKAFEIIAIVLSLFNFANVCTYGFGMNNGNLVGWAVMIICAVIYSKVIKEIQNEEQRPTVQVENSEMEKVKECAEEEKQIDAIYCRKCGEKLVGDSKFCSKCGTEV